MWKRPRERANRVRGRKGKLSRSSEKRMTRRWSAVVDENNPRRMESGTLGLSPAPPRRERIQRMLPAFAPAHRGSVLGRAFFNTTFVVCPTPKCSPAPGRGRVPFPLSRVPASPPLRLERAAQAAPAARCAGTPACLRKQASRAFRAWQSLARRHTTSLEPWARNTTRKHDATDQSADGSSSLGFDCVCSIVCPCPKPFRSE